MAELKQLLAGTIDDYLLSLATGVRQAQRELNRFQSNAGSQGSPTTYHLPKVSFELKITVHLVEDEALQNRYREIAGSGQKRQLLIAPVQPATDDKITAEALSTISGEFVSLPAHQGKPPVSVRSTIRKLSPEQIEFNVHVTNAIGEAMTGVPVQFNMDREESRTLNGAVELNAQTDFQIGVVSTDASGEAVNILRVMGESVGTKIPIVIDVMGQSEDIVYVVNS